MGGGLPRAPRPAWAGIRPVDVVIVVALTALGIALMVENITASDAEVTRGVRDGSMWHTQSAHAA